MSIIYVTIRTLFFVSTISALVAPAVIYSAVIHNDQNSLIQCKIIWSKLSNLETSLFTVEKNNYYVVKENKFKNGGYEGHATIEEIQCGNLRLTAPFDKVDSPQNKWEFLVQSNKIVSVGPSSYAGVHEDH
jgi:hypothetical protein